MTPSTPTLAPTLKARFLGSTASTGYNTAVETIRKDQYPQLKGIFSSPHSLTFVHYTWLVRRTKIKEANSNDYPL